MNIVPFAPWGTYLNTERTHSQGHRAEHRCATRKKHVLHAIWLVMTNGHEMSPTPWPPGTCTGVTWVLLETMGRHVGKIERTASARQEVLYTTVGWFCKKTTRILPFCKGPLRQDTPDLEYLRI